MSDDGTKTARFGFLKLALLMLLCVGGGVLFGATLFREQSSPVTQHEPAQSVPTRGKPTDEHSPDAIAIESDTTSRDILSGLPNDKFQRLQELDRRFTQAGAEEERVRRELDSALASSQPFVASEKRHELYQITKQLKRLRDEQEKTRIAIASEGFESPK